MEETENFFRESRQAIEDYLEERLLLLKLQSAEKTAKLVAVMFSGLLIALLSFFILLFLSIMAGYFFASLTGSQYWGFGIVAAFYIILLIIIIRLRKNVLEKFIINTVITIFFDKAKDETGNEES